MKNLKWTLLSLFSVFVFAGCETETETEAQQIEKELIGVWEVFHRMSDDTYWSSGTFINLERNGRVGISAREALLAKVVVNSGRWQTDGRNITIHYNACVFSTISEFRTSTYEAVIEGTISHNNNIISASIVSRTTYPVNSGTNYSHLQLRRVATTVTYSN